MILLDTTILVYAIGEEHPLAGPCNELLGAVALGDAVATTTIGVLQEFAHVRARRHGRADASVMAHRFGGLLGPLAEAGDAELGPAMTLYRKVPGLGAYDAVLAAVALANRMPLVSADRAFAAVPGLLVHDPSDPEFLRGLGVS